jgi:NAD(P)-dependent dehydrogenase (short-subunit alcohol dehydrogenase family)
MMYLQVMKVNLYSCFNVLRPSVKAMMRSGGGSIAFCTSAVARHGIPNHEAIAAAKAGVMGEQKRASGQLSCAACTWQSWTGM